MCIAADLPQTIGWSLYRTSVIPDPATRGLGLYVYADSDGIATVNEYANVRVVEVPALPSFDLLATPEGLPLSSRQLGVLHNSFSTQWQGPISGEHVLVDGMLNGWLMPRESPALIAYYKPAAEFTAAKWISLATFLITLLLLAWPRLSHMVRLYSRTVSKRSPHHLER